MLPWWSQSADRDDVTILQRSKYLARFVEFDSQSYSGFLWYVIHRYMFWLVLHTYNKIYKATWLLFFGVEKKIVWTLIEVKMWEVADSTPVKTIIDNIGSEFIEELQHIRVFESLTHNEAILILSNIRISLEQSHSWIILNHSYCMIFQPPTWSRIVIYDCTKSSQFKSLLCTQTFEHFEVQYKGCLETGNKTVIKWQNYINKILWIQLANSTLIQILSKLAYKIDQDIKGMSTKKFPYYESDATITSHVERDPDLYHRWRVDLLHIFGSLVHCMNL